MPTQSPPSNHSTPIGPQSNVPTTQPPNSNCVIINHNNSTDSISHVSADHIHRSLKRKSPLTEVLCKSDPQSAASTPPSTSDVTPPQRWSQESSDRGSLDDKYLLQPSSAEDQQQSNNQHKFRSQDSLQLLTSPSLGVRWQSRAHSSCSSASSYGTIIMAPSSLGAASAADYGENNSPNTTPIHKDGEGQENFRAVTPAYYKQFSAGSGGGGSCMPRMLSVTSPNPSHDPSSSLLKPLPRRVGYCFACGAPPSFSLACPYYTGRYTASATNLRYLWQHHRHVHMSEGGCHAPNFRQYQRLQEQRRRYSFGSQIASSATSGYPKSALKRKHSQRRKSSTYWDSFDKYTSLPAPKNYPFSQRGCLSKEFSRSGSLCNSKRRRVVDQFVAISEEKCNGDVRFDLTDQEANLGHNVGEGGSISVDAIRKNTLTHRAIRRRQSGYGISITSESTAKMRCKMRKKYFMKRNRVCDLSLLLGLVGLILVVIDSELTALRIISKHSPASLTLRGLCVLSTLLLVGSLINYHCIEVKIALIDSGADDWRVALTTERIIKLAIEIAVCGLCPFPGSGTISWPHISSASDEHEITMVHVPFDVILSVPMFLRSYLLCRFMVLHSKQFQDAATRSIAALNRISMDFRFVIKTMMADHPLTVLVVFTVSYWICMSWMFTQCERYDTRYEKHFASDTQKHYYLNSLWFIMVTFMSIGYGDVVPHSYCGRLLSITTGIVGAGVSSALIAVISRKLELSRAEKHVNNFMSDSKLTNQRKNAAAAVLQHTWFIHKYQRSIHKGDDLRLRQHQRKFLNAINDFRRIKWDQRKLQEKGNSLLDVGKLHNEMHETLWEMHRTQDQFITQIDMLTQRIVELQAAVLGTQGGHMQQLTHQQSTGSPTPTYHTPATSSPSTQLRQLCAGNQQTNMNSTTPPPMHLRVPGDTGIQPQTHQKQPELRRNVSLAHTPVSNTLDSPPIILNNGSPDNAAYGSFPSLQKFATPLTMRRVAAQQSDSGAGSPSVTSTDSRHPHDNRCSRKSTISAPTAVIINSDEEHDEHSASTPLISRDS
ncbi:calcium-activated SK potassium channel domain-containing protein [Ditylenchus destructor]|nr:calcium-activated SK potassium channel domain-containing protein [Ditylenchus destructor]